MEETLKLFEQWCDANNWKTARNDKPTAFPDKINQRYPMAAKSDYLQFINYFSECYTKDEQSWFLCEQEYRKETNLTEYDWNFCELLTLEAVEDDTERKSTIDWWDNHIPILFSVRDGYSHFSISLEEDSFGQIVEGYEPMFEDTVVIADDLDGFLWKIMKGEQVF